MPSNGRVPERSSRMNFNLSGVNKLFAWRIRELHEIRAARCLIGSLPARDARVFGPRGAAQLLGMKPKTRASRIPGAWHPAGGLGDLQGQHRHAWLRTTPDRRTGQLASAGQSEVDVHGVRANSWPRIGHIAREAPLLLNTRVLPKHATRARSSSISLSHDSGRALPPQLTAALPCPFSTALPTPLYREKSLRRGKASLTAWGKNNSRVINHR